MDQTVAINALSALSHETRLEVFRILVQVGPSGLAAGEIGEELGVLQNTMSTHLGILFSAGLILREREGRVIYYSANYEAMRSLIEYLLQDCCAGDKVICRPFMTKKSRKC